LRSRGLSCEGVWDGGPRQTAAPNASAPPYGRSASASMPCKPTPGVQPRQDGSGGGVGRKSFILNPRDLLWFEHSRPHEGNDACSLPEKKSDRRIAKQQMKY